MSYFTMKRALIIVDLNNDFMPGGALAVKGAEEVLPVINDLAENGEYAFVVATQDWHPIDHDSFAAWPRHCVAGTPGAELHPLFEIGNVHALFRKGFDPGVDSYSGFYNERGETNGLTEMLRARGIGAVDVVGIATDYCVKATAIEAATIANFKTRVLLTACRGVELTHGDTERAIQQMQNVGVEIVANN